MPSPLRAVWNNSSLRTDLSFGKKKIMVFKFNSFWMIFNLAPLSTKCENAKTWGCDRRLSFCERILEGQAAHGPGQTHLQWRRRCTEAVVQQSFIVRMDFFWCKMEHDPKSLQNRSAFRNTASWSLNACLSSHKRGHKLWLRQLFPLQACRVWIVPCKFPTVSQKM